MPGKPRSGFTLVELLVVIVIIAILIAGMLPAIAAVRQATRQMECGQRLGRLALALHQYEGAYARFPAGVWTDQPQGRGQPRGTDISWTISLLPYLEQGTAYRAFQPEAGVYAEVNEPVRRLSLGIFRCPTAADPWNLSFPTADYAGVYHHEEAPLAEGTSGALVVNTPLRRSEFADGLGQTLFFGEKLAHPDDLGWTSGTAATLRNAGHSLRNPGSPGGSNDATLVGGFGGPHPNGAWFALGDGQTKFLAADIAQEVLQQLAQRADGALLSVDDY